MSCPLLHAFSTRAVKVRSRGKMCWPLLRGCSWLIKRKPLVLDDIDNHSHTYNLFILQQTIIRSGKPSQPRTQPGHRQHEPGLTDIDPKLQLNLLQQKTLQNRLQAAQDRMIDKILKEPTLKDVDIVIKCKKYPEFRKELQEIEKQYSFDHNMSLYMTLDKVDETKYFQILKRDKLYVNFYGFKMSQLSEDELAKVYLLWIMKMDDEIRSNITRRYTVVYYHSMSASLAPFIFIRDSFKKLPIQYYALLEKIYVVEAGFLLKNAGMFEFGRLYKLYSRRLHFVESLKELSKMDQIRKNQIIEALPEVLAMESAGSDKRKEEKRKEQQMQQMVPKPKKEQKKDCLTIRLSRHRFDKNNLPIHLVTLIDTMRKHSQMMELEGIFRKSGSIEEEELIIEELSKMETVGVLKQTETGPYCGYAVAGVIKKLFTKLSQPIVPYATYNKIMALQGIKEQDEIPLVKDIIYSLPETNRRVILYVVGFIKNQVLPHENNKMNFYNMSVVLSPCFFRPEVSSLQDLLNSGRFASIVNILFKKFQEIVEKEENKTFLGSGEKEKRGSRSSNGNGGNGPELKPLSTNVL